MTTSHTFAELYQEKITPDVLRELETPLDINYQEEPIEYFQEEEVSANNKAGIPPLPSIMDTVDGFRSINWTHVRQQFRAGINNVGVVIAVISEKTHQLGCFLAEV